MLIANCSAWWSTKNDHMQTSIAISSGFNHNLTSSMPLLLTTHACIFVQEYNMVVNDLLSTIACDNNCMCNTRPSKPDNNGMGSSCLLTCEAWQPFPGTLPVTVNQRPQKVLCLIAIIVNQWHHIIANVSSASTLPISLVLSLHVSRHACGSTLQSNTNTSLQD